jgi:enoyl-CoA hydratase/carnithine racemase
MGGPQPARAEPVLVDRKGPVALVTLNRPDRLNAWALGMGTIYFDILERLARDPEVRAIVVTGAGRAFCAGADTGELSGMEGMQTQEKRPYTYPLLIGKPLIAAIRGACVGIGFQQALCCDLRFVATDAKISSAYARLGLIGECGMTWLLPRLVGTANAADLMLSGRIIGAEEAQRMGLANRVCSPEAVLDEALAYADTLARGCSPWSMRTMKEQLYRDVQSNLREAYARSETVLEAAMTRGDFSEGVKAFKERRSPDFPPLDASLAFLDPAA